MGESPRHTFLGLLLVLMLMALVVLITVDVHTWSRRNEPGPTAALTCLLELRPAAELTEANASAASSQMHDEMAEIARKVNTYPAYEPEPVWAAGLLAADVKHLSSLAVDYEALCLGRSTEGDLFGAWLAERAQHYADALQRCGETMAEIGTVCGCPAGAGTCIPRPAGFVLSRVVDPKQ